MPYRAHRSMTLGGQDFERGAIVPDTTIQEIPELRLGALVRTGLLSEVEVPSETPQPVTTTPHSQDQVQVEVINSGPEYCPMCGEGPFTRMAMHMQAKHDSADLGMGDEG
jgi:hypothetical protein